MFHGKWKVWLFLLGQSTGQQEVGPRSCSGLVFGYILGLVQEMREMFPESYGV